MTGYLVCGLLSTILGIGSLVDKGLVLVLNTLIFHPKFYLNIFSSKQ